MPKALKALGFAGSPRKGGNSETLLAAALDGAAEAGAEIELIRLNDLHFRPCQVCEACKKAPVCVQRDDLHGVYPKLTEADIWLLSAPIYFDGVSGQMKSFFDRLWCFTHEPNKLPGPRAGGVIVTYEDKEREDYRHVAEVLGNYLGWFGAFDPVEILSCPGLGTSLNDARERPGLLDTARGLGRRLAEALS